jgi:hypothetical protein
MVFQSTTKFLPSSRWVLGSLLFIADKFGDMNLLEPESCKVIGSGTCHLPLAPVRVGLVNEAHLKHGPVELRKIDPDPTGDNANHTQAILIAIIDPIYQLPPETDSEGDRQVFIVGESEQPLEKTVEEIA